MENRTFSNSSMDGFMRVLNHNPPDGGYLKVTKEKTFMLNRDTCAVVLL